MLNIDFIKKYIQNTNSEICGVAIQYYVITNYFDSNIVPFAPFPAPIIFLYNYRRNDLLLVNFIKR